MDKMSNCKHLTDGFPRSDCVNWSFSSVFAFTYFPLFLTVEVTQGLKMSSLCCIASFHMFGNTAVV